MIILDEILRHHNLYPHVLYYYVVLFSPVVEGSYGVSPDPGIGGSEN